MIRLTIVAAASAALVACGGGDGGGSAACSGFAPCGGDPVGTWMFVDQCIEGNPLSDTCEEATFDDSNAEISGSVTINDDGSYTSDTETSGTVRSTLPASCFEGVPVSSCDDLDNPDEGFDCSGDIEQACDCVTELSDSSTASGTWRTEDTTLFLNEGTQNESQAQYCVEGDVFRFQTVQGDAMATTVLTR